MQAGPRDYKRYWGSIIHVLASKPADGIRDINMRDLADAQSEGRYTFPIV